MIGQIGTKAVALAGKYGPQLLSTAKSAASKLGSTQIGQKATAAAKKVGEKTVMAGEKLGPYFSSRQAFKEGATQLGQMGVERAVKAAKSEGVQQAGKRALRDTLLYSAAEQAIPRALGQDAPSLTDTLVRQATGNILAEGVTAGLKGRSFFGEKGLSAGDARKIGEVTGQIGGQAIAQTVLPGKQANPFLPSTYMQEEGVPLGAGPTTPTGATKFTAEPEYNQVVRPSTADLSGVQAREALSERERYEYRLMLAQIDKQPSPVMHMSPDSNMQSLNSLAQSMMRQASY
tara:strand:+ start:613 stop:1479 length:867 start_codon:yes stop_codon:yes gene_type:complete